ncbi:hypothetical protein FJZ21_02660 [Candidatus Pacearchaeota archaeon]|nr:hypothetical protein [Candidatus Pacearchaeota archaeon]
MVTEIVGPNTYTVLGREFTNRDFFPLQLEGVIDRVTRFMLTDYTGQRGRVLNQQKGTLRLFGVWGFNNVYWNGVFFYMKKDTFGLGRDLDRYKPGGSAGVPAMPGPPYKQVEYDPRLFGDFTAQEFNYSRAAELLGNASEGIQRLADANNLRVRVNGIEPKRRDRLIRTVCALEFKKDTIVIDLASSENRQHMAIGERPDNIGNPRFGNLDLAT